jgi:hypothetical protein
LVAQRSPFQQSIKRRAQFLAPRRKAVFDFRWNLRVEDALDDAIGLHPAKLLDEHLLGNRRDRTFQVRKAQDLAAKQVKQDDQLPAAFEDFECVLNALGGGEGCQLFRLTF